MGRSWWYPTTKHNKAQTLYVILGMCYISNFAIMTDQRWICFHQRWVNSWWSYVKFCWSNLWTIRSCEVLCDEIIVIFIFIDSVLSLLTPVQHSNHYLNQGWLTDNCTIENLIKRSQNAKHFFQIVAFENVVYKMASILLIVAAAV